MLTTNKNKIAAEAAALLATTLVVAITVGQSAGLLAGAMASLLAIPLTLIAVLSFKYPDKGIFILLKYFPAESILCEETSGKPVRITETSEWHWNWSRPARNLRVEGRPSLMVNMLARPITPNPKVRELHYSVSVIPKRDLQSCQMTWRRGYWKIDTIAKRQERSAEVELFLYDLNERRSGDLGQFFNPLRSEQQTGFLNLVREELNPHLASLGLEVADARFSLN